MQDHDYLVSLHITVHDNHLYLEEIQEIQVQSSIKQQGKSGGDGPENTPTSETQRTESPHLRPWYKNGSDGRDKNPRAQR